MPALKPTNHFGEITWVGIVPHGGTIRSEKKDSLSLDFSGPVGEAHGGLTRQSCVRVSAQHPEGTKIANARQLSIVSQDEIDVIAKACGLDAIDPVWLGATLVIKGIADFTHVPPSARLQGPDGVTLVVDMENRPCKYPAIEMNKDHPGAGDAFKSAAKGMRGVTAWVERPGTLTVGQTLRLHIPDQRAWAPQPDLLHGESFSNETIAAK